MCIYRERDIDIDIQIYKYISDPCNTQSVQILQKQNGHNIYAIMKTMCPP